LLFRVRFKSRMREDDVGTAPTLFLLLAQYQGRAVVPIGRVCADFFDHLSPQKFEQKCLRGQIRLPIIRMERSQKSWKGIHVQDLANYLDERRAAAIKECAQLCGTS
jgi:hypothetical protein